MAETDFEYSDGAAHRVNVSRENPQDRRSAVTATEVETRPGSIDVGIPVPESEVDKVERWRAKETDLLQQRVNQAVKATTPIAHEPVRDGAGRIVMDGDKPRMQPVFTSTPSEREHAKTIIRQAGDQATLIDEQYKEKLAEAELSDDVAAEIRDYEIMSELSAIHEANTAAAGAPRDSEAFKKAVRLNQVFRTKYGQPAGPLLVQHFGFGGGNG